MNRLEETLKHAKDAGRKILVPFLTGFYPDRETFLELLFAMERGGADAVEVGLPFSDPSSDGPVIQASSAAALKGGATVARILEAVAEARGKGLRIPLLYMTYYNPVLAFGPKRFVEEAAKSGADGVLVVDLPPEECGELAPHAKEANLAMVMLMAPTTPASRLPLILKECGGFVYAVSVTGVTGVKKPVAEEVGELVAAARPYTALPILAGFGVSGPESAKALSKVSDGVIVGSALITAMGEKRGEEAVKAASAFIDELRNSL